MAPDIQETYLIEAPEQALALLNPLRGEIIAQLTKPASAAEVARLLNDTPQRINYHLKTLEKVGLVRRTGKRQVRNLVEVLFQAVAKSFVLPEGLSMKPETTRKLKDQGALAHLIHTAERLKQDALLLMEGFDADRQVPSAALQFQVPLGDEAHRAAFIDEYVAAVRALVAKYASQQSAQTHKAEAQEDQTQGKQSQKMVSQQQVQAHKPYQVVLAVYPKPELGGGEP